MASGIAAGSSGHSSANPSKAASKYDVKQDGEQLVVVDTATAATMASFPWPAPPKYPEPKGGRLAGCNFPQALAWHDWLDDVMLVVLFSNQLRCYDVSSGKMMFDVQLDSFYDLGAILRDVSVVVVGTGDSVAAWNLSGVREGQDGVKRVPLEYIHEDSFTPMEGVEFGYSILPGGRLVDIERRDGKTCFVIWSVAGQNVVDVQPFPFPEDFKPEYCNKVAGLEQMLIGDYGESHFTYDLTTRAWEALDGMCDPGDLPGAEGDEELSFFWQLSDLGGSYFATVPKEEFPAKVHVWNVETGCRVADLTIGVDGAAEVRRESDDVIVVGVLSTGDQRWNIRSGELLSGKVASYDESPDDEDLA